MNFHFVTHHVIFFWGKGASNCLQWNYSWRTKSLGCTGWAIFFVQTTRSAHGPIKEVHLCPTWRDGNLTCFWLIPADLLKSRACMRSNAGGQKMQPVTLSQWLWPPDSDHMTLNTWLWSSESDHLTLTTWLWSPDSYHMTLTNWLWPPDSDHLTAPEGS